jgi:hypothetical protein
MLVVSNTEFSVPSCQSIEVCLASVLELSWKGDSEEALTNSMNCRDLPFSVVRYSNSPFQGVHCSLAE